MLLYNEAINSKYSPLWICFGGGFKSRVFFTNH